MRKVSMLFIASCFVITACNAAVQGRAEYEMALKLFQGAGVPKDQQRGFELLTQASELGHPEASLTLGYLYLRGNGVPEDKEKAFEFFLKAAEAGNRDAQYNVGLAYVRGEGVGKDLGKALGWFEKASKQDDAGAQFNLGLMYMNGEGTVKDQLTAYAWLTLAVEKGYEGANGVRSILLQQMPTEIAKEKEEAVAKIRKTVRPSKTSSSLQQNLQKL